MARKKSTRLRRPLRFAFYASIKFAFASFVGGTWAGCGVEGGINVRGVMGVMGEGRGVGG